MRELSDAILLRGIIDPGFVVAPFDMNPDHIYSMVSGEVAERHPERIVEAEKPVYPIVRESTEVDVYINNVRHAIDLHKRMPGKTVISRAICVPDATDADADRVFDILCQEYPDACVFMFTSPATGTWVAATPELLLSASSGRLYSMALAGTRPAGTTVPWDEKNRNEQAIVTQRIVADMQSAGFAPEVGETFTRNAGSIEHICTPISAPLSGNHGNITRLLQRMSPTPALGGDPRDVSLSLISELETHSRAYYGGFAGYMSSLDDFALYVNLRCAALTETGLTCFVGGGITAQSNPADELTETTRKSETLLRPLFYK